MALPLAANYGFMDRNHCRYGIFSSSVETSRLQQHQASWSGWGPQYHRHRYFFYTFCCIGFQLTNCSWYNYQCTDRRQAWTQTLFDGRLSGSLPRKPDRSFTLRRISPQPFKSDIHCPSSSHHVIPFQPCLRSYLGHGRVPNSHRNLPIGNESTRKWIRHHWMGYWSGLDSPGQPHHVRASQISDILPVRRLESPLDSSRLFLLPRDG